MGGEQLLHREVAPKEGVKLSQAIIDAAANAAGEVAGAWVTEKISHWCRLLGNRVAEKIRGGQDGSNSTAVPSDVRPGGVTSLVRRRSDM